MTQNLEKLRAVSWLLCSLCLWPVGSADAKQVAPAKSKAQLWEETERQADKLIEIESSFADKHHFKDKPAQFAIENLRNEGFRCALEYKALPAFKKGSVDSFVVETVPMIYCSKPHVKTHVDDLCRVFWAAFEVSWQDPKRSRDLLWRELGTSPVKDEDYFCRVGQD
jgi:hypothetical protein